MLRKMLYFTIVLTFLFSGCGLSKGKNAETQTLTKEEISKYSGKIKESLEWCMNNKNVLKDALRGDKVIYYKAGEGVVRSKTIGKEDIISIGVNSSSWFPRYSPDREYLYIQLSDSDKNESMIIRIDRQGNTKILKYFTEKISYYDVSPDGNLIAYNMKDAAKTQIFLHNIKENKTEIFSDQTIGGVYPSFTVDGKYIVFTAAKKIRMRCVDSREEQIIVDDNDLKELMKPSSCGRYITYQSYNDENKKYIIWKYDIVKKTKEEIYNSDTICANPSFNKSGDRIVFVKSEENVRGNQKLASINIDGTDIQIDQSSEKNVYFPVF